VVQVKLQVQVRAGTNLKFKLPHGAPGEREARTYNGDLGAEPPVGPGAEPPEAESLSELFDVQ